MTHPNTNCHSQKQKINLKWTTMQAVSRSDTPETRLGRTSSSIHQYSLVNLNGIDGGSSESQVPQMCYSSEVFRWHSATSLFLWCFWEGVWRLLLYQDHQPTGRSLRHTFNKQGQISTYQAVYNSTLGTNGSCGGCEAWWCHRKGVGRYKILRPCLSFLDRESHRFVLYHEWELEVPGVCRQQGLLLSRIHFSRTVETHRR